MYPGLEVLSLPLTVLVAGTAITILVSQDWRWCVVALAMQYLGVFLMIASYWPLSMAITKLLSGWICCVILALAVLDKRRITGQTETTKAGLINRESSIPFTLSGKLLRLLAALLVILAALSVAPGAAAWIPVIGVVRASGGLIVISLGLLHLGMTGQPFRVILGLLTVLSGFEVFYAAVETSILVAGLFSGVTLGLALTGAYLLMISPLEG